MPRSVKRAGISDFRSPPVASSFEISRAESLNVQSRVSRAVHVVPGLLKPATCDVMRTYYRLPLQSPVDTLGSPGRARARARTRDMGGGKGRSVVGRGGDKGGGSSRARVVGGVSLN